MIIAIPLAGLDEADAEVGPSWGRAAVVAVAEVAGGEINSWAEHEVRWDVSHERSDQGGQPHGAHHATVMRFLRQWQVDVVAAPHVGPGMVRMLDSAGIVLATGVAGDARAAVLACAAAVEASRTPDTHFDAPA